MKGKELFDALSFIDDRYLDIADAPKKELCEMKHPIKRRSIAALLAAVICVSMTAVTAAAAGWIPGIFKALQEEHPEDQALFEAAAEANSEAVPEVVEIPKLDYSKFTLFERYYDGETILLGYDLDLIIPEPVVGFEPDEQLLLNIKKGVEFSRIGWNDAQDWYDEPATENAMKYDLGRDAFMMDRMLKGTLSPESYERAWEILEEKGYVCIVTRSASIGDHILINGHDTFEIFDETGGDSGRTDYSTEQGDCIRQTPLPEVGRNQERVTVTLKVMSNVQYWYMDLDGNAYVHYGDTETEEISFELENVNACK